MDHLPAIQNPAYPLPRIVCLCHGSDYDGLGVAGFPDRAGWQIDRQNGPVQVDGGKGSIASPEALLQAWLFFGLLYDMFHAGEMEIPLYDFEERLDDQSVLSTKALKGYLDKLAKEAEGLEPSVCMERQNRVSTSFATVINFFERHWNSLPAQGLWRISSMLTLDHVMSIVILGETLLNVVTQIWPVPAKESPLRWHRFIWRENPLKNRFLQSGWCPSEVSMLFIELDNTGLVLASMLKRPFSDRLKHTQCNDNRCLALQTSDDTYETKHDDGCSGCEFISVDQNKISSILKVGGIPIMYIPVSPEDGEMPKIRIIDYNANCLEYIAISHVWAHGLGNPKANALPLCQVLRLQSLTAQLIFSTTGKCQQPGFWIDTLCIPVDPKFKPMRKLAITRLAETYRQARQVLVLDADLHRCSRHCSRTELATRTVCSGWLKRLWTLQEAVMSDKVANASKVDVQFLEGSIEFNAMGGRNIRSLYHTEYALKTIYSAFPQFRTQDRTFAFLARALQYRTTSKLEDEAICLASILGLNSKSIGSILGASTAEERMQILYTHIEQIPASVLFHRSRTLKNGFRWAPATLLGDQRNHTFSGIPAKCDAEGIHVQFSGYILGDWKSPPSQMPPIGQRRRYIGKKEAEAPQWWIRPRESDGGYATSRSAMDANIAFDDIMEGLSTPALI